MDSGKVTLHPIQGGPYHAVIYLAVATLGDEERALSEGGVKTGSHASVRSTESSPVSYTPCDRRPGNCGSRRASTSASRTPTGCSASRWTRAARAAERDSAVLATIPAGAAGALPADLAPSGGTGRPG